MKRRLVYLFLVAFALWPLVQHGFVRQYGIDPRGLGGWAMNTAPRIEPKVLLFVVENGRGKKFDDSVVPPDIANRVKNYQLGRGQLGRWVGAPDEIGAQLLARFPREGVLVIVQLRHVDRTTGRIVVEHEQHLYRPDGTVQRGILRDD